MFVAFVASLVIQCCVVRKGMAIEQMAVWNPTGEGATSGEDARWSKASTAFHVCINKYGVTNFTNVASLAEDVIVKNWEFKDSKRKDKDNLRNGGNETWFARW